MPRFQWISFENTNVLLRHDNMGEMSEWTPVGQVTFRQVYAATPPRWYGFMYAEPRNELVCRDDTLDEAKRKVEIVVTVTG